MRQRRKRVPGKGVDDARFMREAIVLARQGRGVAPHPRVGVLLVHGGKILGRGWYRHSGGAHAEQQVLRAASSRARGSTLYTTLEPCTWWPSKRTPPCAAAIITARVARVVIAMEDPNPRVCGRGVADLQRAGIDVSLGVGRNAAVRLNPTYVRNARREAWFGRPYVILSSATTVDGKIATRSRRELVLSTPGDFARKDALRASVDAILVGGTTLNGDDPRLMVRAAAHIRARRERGLPPQPAKVGVARGVRLSPRSAFLTAGTGKRYLFTTSATSPAALARLRRHAVVSVGRSQRYPIPTLLRTLYRDGIRTLLVEGGGTTAAAFLAAGSVDDIVVRIRNRILGGRTAPTFVDGSGFSPSRAVPLVLVHVETDPDETVVLHYRVERTLRISPLAYA